MEGQIRSGPVYTFGKSQKKLDKHCLKKPNQENSCVLQPVLG